VLGSLSSSYPSPVVVDVAVSTRDPTCLRAVARRAGAGAVSFRVVRVRVVRPLVVVGGAVRRRRCTALVHPSTQRAVARWRGGGCSVVLCSASLGGPGPLLALVLERPLVVPARSVVLVFLVVILVLWVCAIVVLRRHQCRSTHHPPHEQLLMGLEVGGVSSMVHPHSTHHPPHEQLLVRLEVRGVSSWGCSTSWWGPGARTSSSSVPAIIHSPCPACSGGDGWWVGVVVEICLEGV
jgi:hypothetical protein